MWDGQIARTYYSSSSGGRTESVQDAWPGAAPIPYLRSVADPYDSYSPHHDWGPYNLSSSQLAARLGLGSAIESVHVDRDGSSRAESVVFRLASGAQVTRSGADVARALHLLSDWFSIGELQLSTSSSHVLYGSHVTVTARAAGVTGAQLEQQTANGVWQIVRQVSGPAQVQLQPRASTAFRLVAPGTSGATASVAVAPRCRCRRSAPASSPVRSRPARTPRHGLAPRARRVARRRASDPRLDRQVQDAAAAAAGRLPGHRRGRQARGHADVAPRDAATTSEPAQSVTFRS